MSKDDYTVGFGRTPKHTRFVPGEAGNKGRKKKRPEFQTEMVARIRDEMVTVGGVTMTMLEMAVRSSMATTIKRGNPSDLKALFDLLEKYGAAPKAEQFADLKAAADGVMDNIMEVFYRENDIDPDDVVSLEKLASEEAAIVLRCPDCSPQLRKRWNSPERKALGERYGHSGLQKDVETLNKIKEGGE